MNNFKIIQSNEGA